MLFACLLACAPHPVAPDMPPAVEAPSYEDEVAAAAAFDEAQLAFERLDTPAGRAALEGLVARWPQSRAAGAAARQLDETAIVGQPAPALQVSEWLQGGPPTEGTVLYVFFEVWCPHCQEELPRLDEQAPAWRTRGLEVVGLTRITRDATPEAVRAFLRLHGISLSVAREQDDAMSLAYAVTGIPAAALVKDGIVVWRGHPARMTPALLDAVVGGAP